jgi:acyl-CoA thioesterase I
MAATDPKRLLLRIYGDSLGMPRNFTGIHYSETYPELLKVALEREGWKVDLYNRSKGGVTIAELHTLALNDHKYFGDVPEIVVIQCGIVDCAPRPISGRMRRLIGRLPEKFRSPVVAFLHSKRSRILKSGFRWRVTEPPQFREMYTDLLRAASQHGQHMVAVSIAPTTLAMEEHSPGLLSSIVLYNDIIRFAVREVGSGIHYVDVHNAVLQEPDGLARWIDSADGHHITREGHQLYSAHILAAIRLALTRDYSQDTAHAGVGD